MEKYDIENLLDKKHDALSTDIETLFSLLSSISGTINTIRDLNYILKKDNKDSTL